jgi:hypothetical protein
MVNELDVLESEYAESLFLEYAHLISHIQVYSCEGGAAREEEGRLG